MARSNDESAFCIRGSTSMTSSPSSHLAAENQDLIPLSPPPSIPQQASLTYEDAREYIVQFARKHGYDLKILQGSKSSTMVFRCHLGLSYRKTSQQSGISTDCPFRLFLTAKGQRWELSIDINLHNHDPDAKLLPSAHFSVLSSPYRVHAEETRTRLTACRSTSVKGIPIGYIQQWDTKKSATVYPHCHSQNKKNEDFMTEHTDGIRKGVLSDLPVPKNDTTDLKKSTSLSKGKPGPIPSNTMSMSDLIEDENQYREQSYQLALLRVAEQDQTEFAQLESTTIEFSGQHQSIPQQCSWCQEQLGQHFVDHLRLNGRSYQNMRLRDWHKFCGDHQDFENLHKWQRLRLPVNSNNQPHIDINEIRRRSQLHLPIVLQDIFERNLVSVFQATFNHRILRMLSLSAAPKVYFAALFEDWSHCVGYFGSEIWVTLEPLVCRYLIEHAYPPVPMQSPLMQVATAQQLSSSNINVLFANYVITPEILAYIVMENRCIEKSPAIEFLRSTASLWETASATFKEMEG